MRRRRCAALLLAAPLAGAPSLAQPVPVRIGLLSPTSAQANALRLATLRTTLAELGYQEGRNLVIEARFADGRFDRLPDLVRELMALRVEPHRRHQHARGAGRGPRRRHDAGADRLGRRPGGGGAGERAVAARRAHHRHHQHGARPERQAPAADARDAARGAAAGGADQPDDPIAAVQEADIRGAAPGLGFEIRFFAVRKPSDLPAVFDAVVNWRADAVMRIAEPLLTQHRAALISTLQRHRLPSMLINAAEVREGGLMSYYSVEQAEYRTLAGYIDRILKGANPAELPVQQPTHFELVINQRTARSLGLTVPQPLLLRADEVIE